MNNIIFIFAVLDPNVASVDIMYGETDSHKVEVKVFNIKLIYEIFYSINCMRTYDGGMQRGSS